ncbi:MAG: ferritin family protein [Bacteroides sp.]|jgi:rubrerythrin|nr:ferritin family protein [Bacteroides sp.]
MKTFSSLDEILDFAMNSEQEAVDFYTQLAAQQNNQQIKDLFLEFAQEEVSHKARLQKIKDERLFDMEIEKVTDLKISDYVVSRKPSPELSYADALVLAMKKEKAAFKLYTALAERTNNAELSKVFHALAIEESRHKLRFELEYDEFVMREN